MSLFHDREDNASHKQVRHLQSVFFTATRTVLAASACSPLGCDKEKPASACSALGCDKEKPCLHGQHFRCEADNCES